MKILRMLNIPVIRAKKVKQTIPQRIEFQTVMDNVKRHLEYITQAAEYRQVDATVPLLDFLIGVFTEELRTTVNMQWICTAKNKEPKDCREVLKPFLTWSAWIDHPVWFYDEISSEGKVLITSSYSADKLIPALHHIREDGFRTDWNNYTGNYFPELNMIVVTNGIHHSCVAQQMNQSGIYKVNTYPLENFFDYVHTDGAFWYETNPPHRKLKVEEIRLAILYELARLKREYQLK